PILDTAFAIIRRSGRFHVADKGHLHHRLMFLGHGQRRAVAILWAWTAILSGLVLFPTFTNRGNAVIPFGVLALGVLLYTFFSPGVRRSTGEIVDGGTTVAPTRPGGARGELAGSPRGALR
ncbi:MAG TPA: hypothetical protein VFO65_04275, partial [Acidimicrobiales bacterium]|nr:hypothetical protein [Acidimicrobiales bacterium]